MTNSDNTVVTTATPPVATATPPTATATPSVGTAIPSVGIATPSTATPKVPPAVNTATKEYAHAEKGEFVAKMQGQLDEINREVNELSTKVEKANDTAKAEAKPKFQMLRDQSAKLRTQLDAARNATEATWSDIKSGFGKGFGELKGGFQQTRQWVSEKIAP